MSKNSRDKPYKHYSADYFGWRYYFGGHYLKQYEKNVTNRKFRKVQKKKIDDELQDYISDKDINEQ